MSFRSTAVEYLGVAQDNPLLRATVAVLESGGSDCADHLRLLLDEHAKTVSILIRDRLTSTDENVNTVYLAGNIGSDICEAISESSTWRVEQQEFGLRCTRKETY